MDFEFSGGIRMMQAGDLSKTILEKADTINMLFRKYSLSVSFS